MLESVPVVIRLELLSVEYQTSPRQLLPLCASEAIKRDILLVFSFKKPMRAYLNVFAFQFNLNSNQQ